MRRFYFGSCALLILLGLAISSLTVFFPPEMLDEQGQLLGEMPPGFAVGLLLAFFGAVLAAGGLAACGVVWLAGWGRRKSG